MTKGHSDVTARLTDTSKYTGAHKERFDADGKGKGIAGRETLVKNTGSTSSASRDNTVESSESKVVHKQVVKPKTDAEQFGEKPKKITLFQYADKNHAGEKIVLTKAKFPTFKQLSEATTPFTPAGKPKLIVTRDMKEIKSLDDVEDGGLYLVITSFDKSKLDEAKLPALFK